MLYSEHEVTIMAAAIQPNMRKSYSRTAFHNIFNDFMTKIPLRDQHWTDLGPGQCDMLDILKEHGARTSGFDMDKAVCTLGTARGHTMFEGDLRGPWPFAPSSLDGLFCRGSFNCYWFAKTPEVLSQKLTEILGSLKPSGRIWFVPWNKPSGDPGDGAVPALAEAVLSKYEIESRVPPPEQIQRYGIRYEIPEIRIWERGLTPAAASH